MALERGASKFVTKPVDFPQLKQDVAGRGCKTGRSR